MTDRGPRRGRACLFVVLVVGLGLAGCSAFGSERTSTTASGVLGCNRKPVLGGLPSGGKASITPTHKNVRYANSAPAQLLDLYLPPGAGAPVPLMLNIHGGGFTGGDKSQEAWNAEQQVAAGYAAASINYRLACDALFPAAIADAKAAVRFLRSHATEYGIDPGRIVAWGDSAGAYLAAMVAVTGDQDNTLDDLALGNANVSSEVQAAVVWYGPYDFATLDEQLRADPPEACRGELAQWNGDSPIGAFLGGRIEDDPAALARSNPARYIGAARRLPPFSIAAGADDCVVPHQQSIDLDAELRRAGGTSTVAIVPGAGHGGAVNVAQMPAALAFVGRTLGR